MSSYSDIGQKRLKLCEVPNELIKKSRRNDMSASNSPKDSPYHSIHGDHDKRARREIANSNERRRMQSINSGFETLKTLLPTEDGEKLSKAAILQLTSKYIQHLVTENRRMRDQLSQLQQRQEPLASPEPPSRKRKQENAAMQPASSPSVYVGYFQAVPQQMSSRETVQAVQLSAKPDYEQFVVEPHVNSPPPQPQPQAKRLEHLVMAIEKIEGKLGEPESHQMVSPFTQISSDSSLVNLEDGNCRPRSIPHKYLHRPQVVHANSSN